MNIAVCLSWKLYTFHLNTSMYIYVCVSLALCVSPPGAEGRCHSLLALSHRALAATSQQPWIRQPFQVDEPMPDNNVV